jgi:transposase
VNVNAHVAPQLMPPGEEVTVPAPEPARATVSVNSGTKLAVTLAVAFIVTTHWPVPEQPAPDHPWNTEPGDTVAVSVTDEFVVNAAVQVAPQSMPAGDDVTFPAPAPVRLTVRLKVPSRTSP